MLYQHQLGYGLMAGSMIGATYALLSARLRGRAPKPLASSSATPAVPTVSREVIGSLLAQAGTSGSSRSHLGTLGVTVSHLATYSHQKRTSGSLSKYGQGTAGTGGNGRAAPTDWRDDWSMP